MRHGSTRLSTLPALVAASLLAACGADPIDGSGGGDARASVDGQPPSDAAVADLAAPDLPGPDKDGFDAARVDLYSGCSPPSDPVDQTITIVARNDSNADRFVVNNSCNNDLGFCPFNFQGLSGACMTFGVSSKGAPLPLQLAYKVVCEGPGPPSDAPGGFHRLAPGGTYVVARWSARSLMTCIELVDCAKQGWPQGGIWRAVREIHRKVASGAYAIVVPVENALPGSCMNGGPDDFICTDFKHTSFGDAMPLCTTSTTATVEFKLPPMGNATVVVPIVK